MVNLEEYEADFRELVMRSTKPRRNTKDQIYDPNSPTNSFNRVFSIFKKRLTPVSSAEERKKRIQYFARLFITVLREARIPINEESNFVQAYSGEYIPLVDRKPIRIIERKGSWKGAGLHLVKSHPDP